MGRHTAGQGILRSREQHMAEQYVNSVASAAIPIAMTIEEVKRETAKGSTLQAVISLVRSNKWYDTTQYQGIDVDQAALSNYSSLRGTLTVNDMELGGKLDLARPELQAFVREEQGASRAEPQAAPEQADLAKADAEQQVKEK
ncbi:hypothetical protein LSAT2_031357, partial [Lamellibrachia satsuma]